MVLVGSSFEDTAIITQPLVLTPFGHATAHQLNTWPCVLLGPKDTNEYDTCRYLQSSCTMKLFFLLHLKPHSSYWAGLGILLKDEWPYDLIVLCILDFTLPIWPISWLQKHEWNQPSSAKSGPDQKNFPSELRPNCQPAELLGSKNNHCFKLLSFRVVC